MREILSNSSGSDSNLSNNPEDLIVKQSDIK